jgi:hypothetical protein
MKTFHRWSVRPAPRQVAVAPRRMSPRLEARIERTAAKAGLTALLPENIPPSNLMAVIP